MTKTFLLILVAFWANSVLCSPLADDSLIITLPKGRVQGATYVTPVNNKTYYGFRGIPYAEPPLGDLRFESPQPANSWTGIWNATTDRKSCITSDYLTEPDRETEDCLYINVYIPTLKPTEKLPVMFFIYGGGFQTGNSSKDLYGPDFLIEKDVIFVSFNYRLGPLGFISTGDRAIPGNLGLKDQNLALRWTNDNIEYFGGDPEKITIFGHSAGGAATGLHLVSKQSAGLFRAAIVQSGCAILPWSIHANAKDSAYLIADAIGGGNYGNDTEALKNFLKKQTVEDIIIAQNKVPAGLGPTLELESEDAFITEYPYGLLESGDFRQVPIMIGVASEESLFFLKDLANTIATGQAYDNNPESLIPGDLILNDTDKAVVAERIRDTYLKSGESFSSNLVAAAEYFTDNDFTRPSLKHAELASKLVSVYFYEFAYYGRAITKAFLDGAEKAGHAAELSFIFNTYGISNTTDTNDVLTQERTVELWTNFAKYLNPTPTKSEILENLIWPTFDKGSAYYLSINGTLQLRDHLKKDVYKSWNDIFETYGAKPFIGY